MRLYTPGIGVRGTPRRYRPQIRALLQDTHQNQNCHAIQAPTFL